MLATACGDADKTMTWSHLIHLAHRCRCGHGKINFQVSHEYIVSFVEEQDGPVVCHALPRTSSFGPRFRLRFCPDFLTRIDDDFGRRERSSVDVVWGRRGERGAYIELVPDHRQRHSRSSVPLPKRETDESEGGVSYSASCLLPSLISGSCVGAPRDGETGGSTSFHTRRAWAN